MSASAAAAAPAASNSQLQYPVNNREVPLTFDKPRAQTEPRNYRFDVWHMGHHMNLSLEALGHQIEQPVFTRVDMVFTRTPKCKQDNELEMTFTCNAPAEVKTKVFAFFIKHAKSHYYTSTSGKFPFIRAAGEDIFLMFRAGFFLAEKHRGLMDKMFEALCRLDTNCDLKFLQGVESLPMKLRESEMLDLTVSHHIALPFTRRVGPGPMPVPTANGAAGAVPTSPAAPVVVAPSRVTNGGGATATPASGGLAQAVRQLPQGALDALLGPDSDDDDVVGMPAKAKK